MGHASLLEVQTKQYRYGMCLMPIERSHTEVTRVASPISHGRQMGGDLPLVVMRMRYMYGMGRQGSPLFSTRPFPLLPMLWPGLQMGSALSLRVETSSCKYGM